MLSDIIMIEEVQFFSDLVDNVVKMSLEGKDVIVVVYQVIVLVSFGEY